MLSLLSTILKLALKRSEGNPRSSTGLNWHGVAGPEAPEAENLMKQIAILFPLNAQNYEAGEKPSTRSGPEIAKENDLSYADALLDLQVRLFFRSEYGIVKPPSHVFEAVLKAINENER